MANNGGTTEHGKVHYNCKDCRTFQRDVKYLEHLLDKERARGRKQGQLRLTLCEALDEANAKLAKRQPRKENNCDRHEETWQPEEGDYNDETLQSEDRDEDKEALSTAEFLTETTKQNQETDLQRCYKELQEAHRSNQQRFAVELQAERSKNEALIYELEKLRSSNKEISEKYEVDHLRAKQQITYMTNELKEAAKSKIDAFQAKQNLVRARMMEEMNCLRNNAAEEKMLLQKEVEELTSQLSLMERENEAHTINQQRLAVDLQAERSNTKDLLDELEKLRASNKEISERYEADDLRAKQQITHMRAELEREVMSQMDTFQAEQNLVRARMMEEMNCLRNNAAEEKMLLQKEVEELTSQLSLMERENEAHTINQHRLAVDLQAERSNTKDLLDNLEKLRASNKEISERYEADNLRAKQQITHMRAELEREVMSQMDTFQAEQNLVRNQMMEEMNCLRNNAAEEKMLLQREVEELNSQLSLKEREDVEHQEWQEEKEEEKQEEKEGEEQQEKQEESLSEALPAPEPVETEVSEETPKKKKCPFWKLIRRCLGLRRRKKQ
ncbi:flagellar attachment zone protein 1-like [Paralichthys olivaceus]|uniref:flagellar attachment zone protein 1-like n=1 Tax=Paralichthys olivaceus TaxID=8255 RepID=UPI003753142B